MDRGRRVEGRGRSYHDVKLALVRKGHESVLILTKNTESILKKMAVKIADGNDLHVRLEHERRGLLLTADQLFECLWPLQLQKEHLHLSEAEELQLSRSHLHLASQLEVTFIC